MNPYEVLGVNEGADSEMIKKAYRELVKKYHPDKYTNNPLADLASEKLKEINEAYNMLINKNSTQNNGSYQNTQQSYGQNTYSASYQSVRALITQRRFAEAENMLSGLGKNAEWYYLMGVVCINKGWYDKGREYVQTAVNMEPNNFEYTSTLNSMKNRNTQYRNVNPTGGMSSCDCCTSLLCADCCCECMGGDIISCC